MGGGGESLSGGRDEEFCNKKWGVRYEKKMVGCLELQRGQEIYKKIRR